MAELRSVDPRTLQPNPNNPRTTPVPPAMDEQLLASIKAVGIIQPPCVTPKDDGLMIVVGNRRVKAAIKAELPVIDVLVCDADEAAAAMRVGRREPDPRLDVERGHLARDRAARSPGLERAGDRLTRSRCRSAPCAASSCWRTCIRRCSM